MAHEFRYVEPRAEHGAGYSVPADFTAKGEGGDCKLRAASAEQQGVCPKPAMAMQMLARAFCCTKQGTQVCAAVRKVLTLSKLHAPVSSQFQASQISWMVCFCHCERGGLAIAGAVPEVE